MTFEEQLKQSVENTLIQFIKKGDWLKLEYNHRVTLDSAWLRRMHDSVNMDNVFKLVAGDVERKVADSIINSMATEIATDVKSIMCNKELREDIRSVIRSKIREVNSSLTESKS